MTAAWLESSRGPRVLIAALAILLGGTATVLAAPPRIAPDNSAVVALGPMPARQPPALGPSTVVLPADALPSPPGTTDRVSVSDGEQQANSGSGGVTALLTAANGDQAISGDGRWVAFVSTADNLVPGGSQPGGLFLRDRQDGTTTGIPWIGGEPFPTTVVAAEPTINQDGSAVAFTAIVTTTLRGVAVVAGAETPYVLVWDRFTGTELVSMDDAGQPAPGFQPSISADGRYVAYTRWAPQATPPPTPTPRPNTAPSISGLRASLSCVDGPNSSSTVSVNAVDPDGDSLSLRIVLSWTDGSNNTFSRLPAAMTPAGNNTWTYLVSPVDLSSYGWTGGQIRYAVTARDARGADSQTLTDNPFQDPPTNSIVYQPSGCTIL